MEWNMWNAAEPKVWKERTKRTPYMCHQCYGNYNLRCTRIYLFACRDCNIPADATLHVVGCARADIDIVVVPIVLLAIGIGLASTIRLSLRLAACSRSLIHDRKNVRAFRREFTYATIFTYITDWNYRAVTYQQRDDKKGELHCFEIQRVSI